MSQNDSHVNEIAMHCYLRNIYEFKHYNIILNAIVLNLLIGYFYIEAIV